MEHDWWSLLLSMSQKASMPSHGTFMRPDSYTNRATGGITHTSRHDSIPPGFLRSRPPTVDQSA